MTTPKSRRTRLSEYKPLVDRNLSGQQEFLESKVKAALKSGRAHLTADLVRELNKHAVEHISETAGVYRKGPIEITNTEHRPPDAKKIAAFVKACLTYIDDNWAARSPMHLAAYALWNLGWVHPFMEGNGRTARAVAQMVICIKYGVWMSEKELMPKKTIRGARARYYAALRAADESFEREGVADLSMLEGYLKTLVFKGAARTLVRS